MARPTAWVSVVLVATLGCEYRAITDKDDPAIATGEDGGLPAGTVFPGSSPDQCEPVAQSCSASARCAPSCDLGFYACTPRLRNGQGRQGTVCTIDDDCQRGFVCVTQIARGGNNATRCARYCRSNSDCTDGTRCSTAYMRCQRPDGNITISRYLCQTMAGR